MSTVELSDGRWTLGERLGGGGFGRVYRANNGSRTAAIKFVPKEPGADREYLFAELGDAPNVVPILDAGETDDEWVLAMPLAEYSLAAILDARRPSEIEAIEILLDVADALAALEARVVHRDIKPDNVLFLDGSWCLADFGIARYADAATSPDTRKWAMTPHYASPEQWRMDHATSASDVYSFGVMAYEVVSGVRPFDSPDLAALRDMHLHSRPRRLDGVDESLASAIDRCLLKAAAARPRACEVVERLRRAQASAPSAGLAQLRVASRAAENRMAAEDAELSRQQSEQQARNELFTSAVQIYGELSHELRRAIEENAPAASFRSSASRGFDWQVNLGSAGLAITHPETASNDWGGWDAPAFDVIASAQISVRGSITRQNYEGRSHSIWYCDAIEKARFEWHEVAFMDSPLVQRRSRSAPFALHPGERSAKALWSGMAEYQVAWPFTPLLPGSIDEFIGRWAKLLAEGAEGPLHRPQRMPERDADNWRRA